MRVCGYGSHLAIHIIVTRKQHNVSDIPCRNRRRSRANAIRRAAIKAQYECPRCKSDCSGLCDAPLDSRYDV